MIKKLLGLALAAIMLSACGPQQRVEDPDYAALKAQAEAQPNDMLALGRWADTAQGRFRATGQGHYRDDAITAYGRFLESNPGHVGASVALYSMLGSRYITHADSQDMQRVRELFAATSLIKTSPGLAPPSLIEALIFVKRGARIDAVAAQMRDLLRAAIRENPNNPTSHLLLADTYYGTDRPALAEAMIEQAYQAAPENPRVLNARAVMYYERAESSMCSLDRDAHRSDLSQAVDALKAAAKANPKKAELARHLSNMYEAMGRPQLALFQARRFDELADNADSRWYLLDQFTAARQFEDAKRQGEINIERDGRDAFVLGQLAMVAYQQGDRESALTLFREYRLLARRPSVYNLVREANLAESAGRQAQASKALAAADVESGSFEAALLSYHRKTLDNAGLLAAADDACEASEAHYFIARRALREGDKPLAREHFHKTLALRVPRYFEHVSATMRLDEM